VKPTRLPARQSQAALLFVLLALLLNPFTLHLPLSGSIAVVGALLAAALFSARRGLRMSPARVIAMLAAFAAMQLLVIESSARLYWKLRHRVPLLAPQAIRYAFYPELAAIREQSLIRPEETFDVLLLGASTLTRALGAIESTLREELTARTGLRVRTHNAAVSAQSSRDSLFKYRALADRHFDLVILYDGINDVRSNNCPPEVFRADYSHAEWYRLVNMLDEHPERRFLAYPYTLRYLLVRSADALGLSRKIPRHAPREEWLEHGRQIKTAGPFRENVRQILELARAKREPLVLMTFAYHVPAGYSLERFAALALDYTTHASPIEIWGLPRNVVAGLVSHNLILERLADEYPETIFVDQHRLLPKRRLHFNDICHLTTVGSQSFVQNLIGPVLERLELDHK
jgi:hypothetical protein